MQLTNGQKLKLRLDWVRRNKKNHLELKNTKDLWTQCKLLMSMNDVGVKVILPSTIYGSPRFYTEAFQDTVAIVRHLGKPNIFITFTCNPKWPEIISALNSQEQAWDSPDLSC
ncbi:hypothetical protein ElyMa_001481000 [Elysia marginata]|uniref:Helitron helicase-like domain-containing protein n=1 Tax=Elysia marginata TaxID=1093978 RepID=A0AAV4J494_9GAST|nr:hypothetical protein ElyMa_001481000 [Elysia marginata]